VKTWIAVLAVGGGSYLARVLPLVLRGAGRTGPRVQRLLGYAGLAAITALVAAALRHYYDATDGRDGVAAVAATAVATLVSRWNRPFIVSIGAALAAYLVLALMLGTG
jgi:branched-subunit amino acid transport protein